jgi:ribosomal protein L7/L12
MERALEQLDRIERKLDLIMARLGIEEPDGMDEVGELVRAGEKIEAMKRYRELTGVTLQDAKDAVENWA